MTSSDLDAHIILRKAIFKTLGSRKGFEWWWVRVEEDGGEELQQEIREQIDAVCKAGLEGTLRTELPKILGWSNPKNKEWEPEDYDY